MSYPILPRDPEAYVRAVTPLAAIGLAKLTPTGIVRGGLTGGGRAPNAEVLRRDGSIWHYRIIEGNPVNGHKAERSYDEDHLSDPLNDALAASVLEGNLI